MSPFGELSLALRALRRSPASAVIAVFALGVGIGLSTLIFSIMQGALLRGLPFHEAHELVRVDRFDPRQNVLMPTIHDFAAWQEGGRSFETLGAYLTGTVNLSGGGEGIPEPLRGASITPSVLELLGVRPVLGRLFTAADDAPDAPPVILLGWTVWQRRFNADRDVVGRTVRANGVENTIVGVLPEGFGFPESQQIWRTMRMAARRIPWERATSVQVIGRLRDDVSAAAATADLNRVAARIAQEHPETHRGMGVRVAGFSDMSDDDVAMLYIMFGAVLGVLIIACVNVANLLIGRAIVRTKEVGIRVALGASRWRVALPFLAESAVLAVAGALLGIIIAYVGLTIFLRAIEPRNPPFWMEFSIDGTVLGFVALAAALAALLSGIIPAWQAARLSLHDTLKDESRGATGFRLGRMSRALVVAEIALSLALLTGAGLMIRSVVKLNTIDLGVPADRLFVARVALPLASYKDEDARRRFAADLIERLGRLSGAQSFALASSLPGLSGPSSSIVIQGNSETQSGDANYAMTPTVSSGYFAALDAELVRGRDFTPADDAGAPRVAIINRTFEQRHFPDGSAVGRRIRIGSDSMWLTIVGVSTDLRESGIRNRRPEAVYLPLAQNPIPYIQIALRAPGNPLDFATPVRELVQSIDPDLPIYNVKTLRQAVYDTNFVTGIFGGLFTSFGSAALVLAAIGLYGVMSFSVSQRRREMGVRMAIGARPGNLLSLVLVQGMRQVILGLLIGSFLAFALSRAIASQLFGVSPQDPLTLVGIVLLMIAVAAAACALPALRATRIDPLAALRAE